MRKLFLIVVLIFSSAAFAFEKTDLPDWHWRMIGPFRGGRVLAVAGISGERDHYYFGSVNGGVWETTDAGRTWNPIFDQMSIGSIGAIAIAPSNPKIIYVGSGEADMRSDIANGNGMYKSTDGGKTWTHIGLVDSHQIGKILIDPDNPDHVYVAALGHAYGPNEERGVFESTDGGLNWLKILYKDRDTGAIEIIFGENKNVLYAALWQTRRPPWNVYPPSKGPGSGLYKSTDAGKTWKQLNTGGFPIEEVGRIGLAIAPSNPRLVYAMVDGTEKEGGLYKSEDAGVTWKFMSGDDRIWGRGWYFAGITVDPKNPDIVYACNTALYKSSDGGQTFVPFRGSPGGDDYHTLWIDPNDPARMFTGVDQGAIITSNGGETWSSWYNEPIGQFYHVITDHQFPYWVYGAQQDSGAAAIPSMNTTRDGINMEQFHEITAGGENGYIAPDPLDPSIVYGGSVLKLDMRTDQTQDVDPTFGYPNLYRGEWTLPLIFSPRDPHVLYYGNQYLFRTNDGGKHWDIISPDLTRDQLVIPPNLDEPTKQNSAELGPRRAVIYSIAPSPLVDHMIWAGTDDGLIWLTNDEGAHWQNITPPDLAPWSKIAMIAASRFDAQTAYVTIDRHRVDDFRPYIYRTTDAGKSWSVIAAGIADGSFVNAVREDTKKKGLLYAGTELGMYVSLDDGAHWQSLQLNLPITSIRDIDVHESDLVIATHGRAFWILDNISALRQLDGQTRLFIPLTANRLHPAGFTGTPLPKDEPMGENPIPGAAIDYLLTENVSGPVTLDIKTADGEPVAHFSSTDEKQKIDISKIAVTPNWADFWPSLSSSKGLHRFVWDLHYPYPKELVDEPSKDASTPRGIWALPGKYMVVLTVNGKTYTESLTVQNDPRVHVSQADLVQQFQFAKRLQATRIRLKGAYDEVKAVLKDAEKLKKTAPKKASQDLDVFEKAITDLTELRAVPVGWYGTPGAAPTRTTSLLYLSGALRTFETTVDNVDAAPSPDVLKGFEQQEKNVSAAIEEWNKFKLEFLAQMNRQLSTQGLTPLKTSE